MVNMLKLCSIIGFVLFFPQLEEKKKVDSFINPIPTELELGTQKIQVAILLDVSNSMDGLINQAKEQLWNMVNLLGKVECNHNTKPNIEIALYEYGRSTNNANDGFVKQVSNFTSNLDSLSQHLFSLTTNGGDEYCGQVMFTSLSNLNWSNNSYDYKVIFIAGNEDFLQGNLHYSKACNLAKQRGVLVNTIYCGSKNQGIQEHWNLGAECGLGKFTFINSNQMIDDIETPYDSAIYVLNSKLNYSYIAYNQGFNSNMSNVVAQDKNNGNLSKKAGLKRVEAKANNGLYNNSSWDLVDAYKKDSFIISKVERKYLPDSLKKLNESDLKKYVVTKQKDRDGNQEEITKLTRLRNDFLKAAKDKKSTKTGEPTLETEIEKIIKEQVKGVFMKVGS